MEIILHGWLSTLSAHGRASLKRASSLGLTLAVLAASFGTPTVSRADDTAQQLDRRMFSQTGYRVDRDSFWDYFQARGGVTTFGYPVSRDFPFEGCTSQFFQRLVMQQCANQGVGTLNLLDDGLLPYTRMNGSTFPAVDPLLTASAPKASDPTYATAILSFVRVNTADTFNGQAVNFQKTFFGTLTPDQAGTDDPAILGLLALEIWGVPTSRPAYDPANRNFIYQRFQRGIMHYDKGCGCTQGLLLADYLKALLTGNNLPADLAAQAAQSPLLRAVGGTAPAGTVFGNAFVQGAGSATAGSPSGAGTTPGSPDPQNLGMVPLPVSTPAPGTQVYPPPAPVPSPDYGLSMFLWDNPGSTSRDLTIASGSNFHWQKTLFQWRSIEGACKGCFDWTESDRVVKASQQAGVKIIARVDFEPAWARKDGANNAPPDNYQDYADFVNAFANRYRPGSAVGPVDAIEVWNEVNIDREWGNQTINRQQARDYVQLLTLAYRAAKSANPTITVVTAGLSPTGVENGHAEDDVTYMQWLFDAGLKGGVNYDVLGAHGNTQAPEVDVALNSLPAFGHPSFYFRRIEQLREVQVKNGDSARQIWLLEFGWTADQIHPDYAWFAVSEQKKADNIIKAFQYAKTHWSPWIGVMTVWTLADPAWTPANEQYWWAIDEPNGTPRAALNAVRAARLDGTL
jgi:polysaccharide biosynthesis protein PslG